MIELSNHIKKTEPKLVDVDTCLNEITAFLSGYADLLSTSIESDSDWTLFKKVRKQIGDQINAFRKVKKDLPKELMMNLNRQIDELIDPLQECYAFFDSEIKAYETNVGCGSVLAAETRKKHTEEKKALEKEESLIVTIECQTKEQKQKLIEFATSIGATVR